MTVEKFHRKVMFVTFNGLLVTQNTCKQNVQIDILTLWDIGCYNQILVKSIRKRILMFKEAISGQSK